MENSAQTLAAGCFGKVYKKQLQNGTWAAVKKVPVDRISKEKLRRECEVYSNTHHPNVVKPLCKPWIEDSKWIIPLEFIFGEDLQTTIFKTKPSAISLTPAVKATIITGMCEGLLYLHSKDIVHQDLKPDNIMVEHQTHRAVIIDLGLAKFSRNGLSSAANMGNEAYSAPEILQSNGVRDKRSDVWAMGKIIAELCVGRRLLAPLVSASRIQETLRDHPYCHPVSRMVEDNPHIRASMAAVISDIRRAGSASHMIVRPMDVTVTQRNETGANTMFLRKPGHLQGAEKPFGMLFHQEAIPQQIAQVHPVDLNHQQPLMSYRGPLPESGRVIQRRYNVKKKCVEVVNIGIKDGKIIDHKKKFEYE